MNPEVRLANIVTALEQAGIACLVMGGHAVRFYGLLRNTVDFDLQLSWHSWKRYDGNTNTPGDWPIRRTKKRSAWRSRSNGEIAGLPRVSRKKCQVIVT